MNFRDISYTPADIEASMVQALERMIFGQHHSTEEKIERARKNHGLLLLAQAGQNIAGFKLGYVIPGKQVFFSWLGGVAPPYRRQGIARELLRRQEAYARSLKMEAIYFTSYDRFPGMIALGLNSGYHKIKSERDENNEIKYWFQKSLIERP